MLVKRIKISELVPATHNPKNRTKKGSLAQLQKSIVRIGLIYPIAVSKDLSVIDGHRRLQAVKNLGWDDVPVLMVESDDKDAVYAEVNANACKLNGRENLQVWLKNPRATTNRASAAFSKWEARVGRAVMQKIAKAGMSVRVLRIASKISQYVDSDGDEFLVKAVLYMIEHRNSRLLESMMYTNQPAAKIYKAIKSGKALSISYQAK